MSSTKYNLYNNNLYVIIQYIIYIRTNKSQQSKKKRKRKTTYIYVETMLSASALTDFLSSVCSDGVDHAIVVNSEGSLLGVGTAENVTTNVSKKKRTLSNI